MEEKNITIANEANLWALWDPRREDEPDNEPFVTGNYMAEMLGVDYLTLSTMYADFLDRHNASCAAEVRMRETRVVVEQMKARAAAKAEPPA